MTEPKCIWRAKATLGEGPVWVEREQSLYFVDIKSLAIHRYEPASGTQKTWVTPGQPGFVLPTRAGGFVVGMGGKLCTWDATTGELAPIASIANLPPGDRINDGYADKKGRLWFGTLNESNTMTTGKLYRLSGGGEDLVQCDDGYIVSNGPVVSEDGRTLYHSNSLERIVYAFDLDDAGNLSRKRPFLQFEDNVFPDGMAMDQNDNLWIALFNGWRIECFSPAAERLDSIAFPCAQVTKPAFGGANLRTLYVTTARLGFTEHDAEQQPLAGSLFAIDLSVAGAPAHLANF